MKRFPMFLAALALAFLTACAGLGVPPADTFAKKALAAHSTVEAIAKSATTLRAAGKMSDTDRDNLVASLRSAETAIDLASDIAKTDPTGGATKLDSAVAILTVLQSYMLTKGAK